jgi:hypothetical protein
MTNDSASSEFAGLSRDELERHKIAKDIEFLNQQIARPATFGKSISEQLTSQFFSIVIPVLVVVLTFASTLALESIKGRETAKQERTALFQKLSHDLGALTFLAETEAERMKNNWTSVSELSPVTTDYNKSIEEIRFDEYKTQALLRDKFGTTAATEFATVMQNVRQVDKAVHGLNEEMGRLIRAKDDKLPGANSLQADPKIANHVADEILTSLDPFTKSSHELIGTLSSKL